MDLKKNPAADLDRKFALIFSFSLVVSELLVIICFEWRFQTIDSKIVMSPSTLPTEELLDIPPTVQEPPKLHSIKHPRIIEVPDDEKIEETIQVSFESGNDEVASDTITHVPAADIVEESDEIFLFVEAPPAFPGGDENLLKFLQQNIKYPARARRMGIEGRVFIKAVIEKDGTITQAQVIKGIGGGCDEEALRVVKEMPPWLPGKQRGRPVRTGITFPIIFRLQ